MDNAKIVAWGNGREGETNPSRRIAPCADFFISSSCVGGVDGRPFPLLEHVF